MTKVYARHTKSVNERLPIPFIKHCIRETLRFECVTAPCELSVLITDDEGIREINSRFRGLNKPTDVLSFPAQNFSPGGFDLGESDPETGLVPLGDIVISAERVDKQARQYGYSLKRETAYLIIHSVLHLLGYDHMDKAEKRKMRAREEDILGRLNI